MNALGLIKLLFKHAYKSTVRKGFVRGGWPAKLLVGFFVVYFLAGFALLGYFLPQIAIKNTAENETVIQVASQFLLYILLSDLIMRFFFQSSAGINIKHYILQPVYYKKLIHLLLIRSVFNFFNALLLLFIIPFSVRAALPEQGLAAGVFFTAGMVFLMLFNSLIADYLRRVFAGNFKAALLMVVILAGIFATEMLENIALTHVSQFIFGDLLASPAALLLAVMPVLAYRLNQRHLAENRYGEMWKVSAKKSGFLSRLEWSGKDPISQLTAMEWKLILRNKRTRSVMLLSVFFTAYGLIFYKPGTEVAEYNTPMLAFIGTFITAFAAMNYGQFLSAWEAKFFDGIFSRNIQIEDYYRAKFRLLSLLVGISFALSLFYGFLDAELMISHTVFAVYNVGVNLYILLFFSTYQRKKIDLDAGSVFNYQGTSAVQFLIMIPLLVVPVFIFFAVSFFFERYAGYAVIAAIGILSLAMHKFWISGIADNFREKKHAMAMGFRRKD